MNDQPLVYIFIKKIPVFFRPGFYVEISNIFFMVSTKAFPASFDRSKNKNIGMPL